MSDYNPQSGKPETWVPGVTVLERRCGCIVVHELKHESTTPEPCGEHSQTGTWNTTEYGGDYIPRLDVVVDCEDRLIRNGDFYAYRDGFAREVEGVEGWNLHGRKAAANCIYKCDPPDEQPKPKAERDALDKPKPPPFKVGDRVRIITPEPLEAMSERTGISVKGLEEMIPYPGEIISIATISAEVEIPEPGYTGRWHLPVKYLELVEPRGSAAKIRTKPNRYTTEAEDAIAEQLDNLEARKSQPCASPQIRYVWGIGRQCRCGRPWGECGDPTRRPRRIKRESIGTCETCGEQEISGLCDPIDGGCRICSDCYATKMQRWTDDEDQRILDQADEIRRWRESEVR